ncbi:SPOR domain-containing protein [Paenibacillus sp. DMB20]|uniref:SPOR domain-containing protein n=1 Tax=Paenibacillus sp. DMB20 TaxID=1642570 RepID=UPI000627A4A2|nr:SPOR domain-containing protein [Paenibacillus sp. DMB20]KKO51849.1 hypothetical protein XI25_23300 [Paenibacillus sp. DMB20]
MNKARMTIRFDQEDDRLNEEFRPYRHDRRGGGSLAEEHRRLLHTEEPDDGQAEGEIVRGPLIVDPEKMDRGIYAKTDVWYEPSPESEDRIDYLEPSNMEGGGYAVREDYGYYRSRRPTSVWKLAGSITAAVLTGLLFGTIVLNMFNGGTSNKEVLPEKSGPDQTAALAGENDSGTDGAAPAAGGASIAVSIPEKTFYLLQYGVFSTGERAEQAKGELTQSGLAAYGDTSMDNRVYAGVSPDREQAKLLSSQLKDEGVELYVREVTMPGAQSAIFAGDAAALDIFFEVSGGLASQLSLLSSSLLSMESPGPVNGESMKAITGLHLQWIEAIKLVSLGLGPEAGTELKNMEQSMNSSVTALSEYNKNRAKGHLWEIQAGMMNYIMSQRKLVEAL